MLNCNSLLICGIDYHFIASTLWLWNMLGSFIIVEPSIYRTKLPKASNLINGDYNARG